MNCPCLRKSIPRSGHRRACPCIRPRGTPLRRSGRREESLWRRERGTRCSTYSMSGSGFASTGPSCGERSNSRESGCFYRKEKEGRLVFPVQADGRRDARSSPCGIPNPAMGFCVVQIHGGCDGSSVGIVYRMITQVDREVGKVVLPLVVDQAVVARVVEPLGVGEFLLSS